MQDHDHHGAQHAAASRTENRAIRLVLAGGLVLAAVKFLAWYYTGSNGILTDALESMVNIAAGAFAVFSVYMSSQPRDENHPYGHGKIEFLSAGFEGGLIMMAGLSMLVKAIVGFFQPVPMEAVGLGTLLSSLAGAGNLLMGAWLIRLGKRNHSLILVADGRHLLSDTVSSAGLVLGLGLIWITGWVVLDNVIALGLSFFILYTGYQLVREAIAGLMDEADFDTVEEVIQVLREVRRPEWIDIHNLRIQKYGKFLHIDAHVTLPWYRDLRVSHDSVTEIEALLSRHFKGRIEIFLHADPCLPHSCTVCSLECAHRQQPQTRKVEWKLENLLPNRKHGAEGDTGSRGETPEAGS